RRLRERRPDISELGVDQRQELETGIPFATGCRGDLLAFRSAWAIHGEQVTEEYVRESPGRRHFAWWLLTHGRERPIVADWADRAWVEAWGREENAIAYLHTSIFGGRGFEPFQEPEESYLDRCGLLTAEERRALGR